MSMAESWQREKKIEKRLKVAYLLIVNKDLSYVCNLPLFASKLLQLCIITNYPEISLSTVLSFLCFVITEQILRFHENFSKMYEVNGIPFRQRVVETCARISIGIINTQRNGKKNIQKREKEKSSANIRLVFLFEKFSTPDAVDCRLPALRYRQENNALARACLE
jgi:hypothetical protein